MVMERDRRRKLNEKLYVLRSVVPNITKMDKTSIIRDAIAYIEKLQEEERRMLAEISALESSVTTVKTEDAGLLAVDDADSFPWWKKPRRAPPADDGACTRTAASHPVQILEVITQLRGSGRGLLLGRRHTEPETSVLAQQDQALGLEDLHQAPLQLDLSRRLRSPPLRLVRQHVAVHPRQHQLRHHQLGVRS